MTTAELIQAVGKGVAACGLFAAVFYRSMKAFWMMIPVGVTVALVSERKRLKNRRWNLLAVQFKESMVILASALSSGYAMENALAVSREELSMLYGEDGLITREFSYMIAQRWRFKRDYASYSRSDSGQNAGEGGNSDNDSIPTVRAENYGNDTISDCILCRRFFTRFFFTDV